MRSIIFLLVVYIVKWIIDEISKPEVSDVDQIINTITEKKTVIYISNGVELKTTLKRHSLSYTFPFSISNILK